MTHAITIQNIGRKTAEFVEVVHKNRPDNFALQPSLDFTESTIPTGEHVIRVKSIGPKETFTIQMLSYATLPELQYIRPEAGHAQNIAIQPQRIFPKWLNSAVTIAMVTGAGFIVYWGIRARQ